MAEGIQVSREFAPAHRPRHVTPYSIRIAGYGVCIGVFVAVVMCCVALGLMYTDLDIRI